MSSASASPEAGPSSPTGLAQTSTSADEGRKRKRPRGDMQRATRACVPCRSRKCRCQGAPPEPCPQCVEYGAVCVWPEQDGRSSAARRAQLRAPRKRREASSLDGREGRTPVRDEGDGSKPSINAITSTPSTSGVPTSLSSIVSAPPPGSLEALFAAPGDEADLAPLFDATQYILALSSQLPTIEAMDESPTAIARRDDPLEPQQRSVRLTWWRPHGPTAIVPGLKRVTIKVRLDAPPAMSPGVSPGSLLGVDASHENLFDESGLPRAAILTHLLDIFEQHFECQFPALSRVCLETARERGNAFLLNCVAAMAARFSHHPAIARGQPHEYGQVFQVRAESLLASSLAVPTRETVGALVLLAHLGLSNASESHMWMYTGMAVRMALDLGLHLNQAAEDTTEEDRRADRLAFWPVLLLDFSLSFGTGRRTTFDLDDITQRVPAPDDVHSPTPSPFPYAARQMLALGPIINLLNGGGSTDALQRATAAAVEIYRQLPGDMVWNAANLQRHGQARQSGIFLQLHLWMHAMISNDYLSRPEGAGATAPDVWRNSVRTIGDILVLADVIDPLAYVAVPYVNQAFYVAGCCYMKDLERYTPPASAAHSDSEGASGSGGNVASEPQGRNQAELFRGLLNSAAITSIATLRQGLERMTTYWSGISWILGALTHRAAGIPRNDIDLLAAQEQLAPYVSQPDVVGMRDRPHSERSGTTPQFDLSEFDLFSLPFTTDGVDAITTAGFADFARAM